MSALLLLRVSGTRSPSSDKGPEVFVLAQTLYRERMLEPQPTLYGDASQS